MRWDIFAIIIAAIWIKVLYKPLIKWLVNKAVESGRLKVKVTPKIEPQNQDSPPPTLLPEPSGREMRKHLHDLDEIERALKD